MLSAWLFKKHLEDDETLKCVVHKHWLLGVRALFWPTVWIVIVTSILLFNQARGIISVVALIDLVLAIWWLRNFFDYFLDAWIITDHGIIDIAWFGWFHRQSSRVLYSDLQGISYEIEGVWGTVLQYGTVTVEKISTGKAVSLESVGRPKRVELMVLQNMEKYLHSRNMKDSKQIQELLASLIADQMHLNELKTDEDTDE